MEILNEMKPEIDNRLSTMDSTNPELRKYFPETPPVEEVIKEFTPFPPEAMFLGVASDGLPVLLNLHDPIPGCLLVIGDCGSGKTNILKSSAAAISIIHPKENVQFGVVTKHPEEWEDFDKSKNNIGIFSSYHQSSEDLILSLASWAHGNKTNKQSIVLFFDGLENISDMDFDARQNLRWLLLRGAVRRVWVVATINSEKVSDMLPWVESFITRIFGSISNPATAKFLGADEAELSSLNAGNQFCIKENGNWLRFWIPSVKE